MNGKVAMVTGAARGIGKAIADRLAGEGWRVLKLDRDFGEAAAQDCLCCDLADLSGHDALVDAAFSRTGRIDCLINNAGIASPRRGDFLEMAPETFDAVIDVNLRGTVFFTQAVLKAMLAATGTGRRSIQFITSASAIAASPERLDYCMSKAALSMFAKGLALRLAPEGIDVYEIRPGIIRTAMTAGVAAKYDALIAAGVVPEGRWGEPADIAAISAALAAGALPFATGSVIEAGGGLTIPRL